MRKYGVTNRQPRRWRSVASWIRETYGIGAWKEWDKPRGPGRAPVPEEYRRAQVRYYKWVYRLGIPLIAYGLLFAAVGALLRSTTFDEVASVPALLLALAAVGHSLINGPRYFWQKHQAGFRVGPWGEIPRKVKSRK